MSSKVLWKSIETKHGEYIHVAIIHHQSKVTKPISNFNIILYELPMQDEVGEDLHDLFKRFQVYVFLFETRKKDCIDTVFLNQDL